MIFLSILLFIFARSLYHNISSIFTTRMAALAFIYAFALTFNALYIQIIGSGIGIYCGLFQITYYSLFIESFIYIVGSMILLSWGLIYKKSINSNNSLITESNIRSSEFNIIKKNEEDLKFIVDSPKPQSNLNYDNLLLLNKNISGISTSSEARDCSLICLFSSLGSSFLISSGDLLSMYLSIELQSFGLYILATIYRESGSATSAGLKYFLLGGLSSCLILLGTGLIYALTGLTDLNSIYSMLSVLSSISSENTDSLISNSLDSLYGSYTLAENFNLGLSLGFIFIIVGFLFKVAGAPFHNWSPDVYDESPSNITIWLTIMPKIAIFLFLFEVYANISLILPSYDLIELSQLKTNLITNTSFLTGLALTNILLLSSFLSLIIGTVVGLAQIRIKRLFAYSTISHVGFLLLALAIKTEQSTESFLFYLIQYTITNLNAFFILLAFGYIINNFIKSNYINSDIRNISELKGQFVSNPILSLSLVISLFSMAGIR